MPARLTEGFLLTAGVIRAPKFRRLPAPGLDRTEDERVPSQLVLLANFLVALALFAVAARESLVRWLSGRSVAVAVLPLLNAVLLTLWRRQLSAERNQPLGRIPLAGRCTWPDVRALRRSHGRMRCAAPVRRPPQQAPLVSGFRIRRWAHRSGSRHADNPWVHAQLSILGRNASRLELQEAVTALAELLSRRRSCERIAEALVRWSRAA
jgi:hypothetical protein